MTNLLVKSSLLLLVAAMQSIAFSQPVYYPLNVGTRWHYYNTTPLSSYKPVAPNEVIKDTIMSNGKKYAIITLDNSNERQYQRAENDSVFFYSIYTHQETLQLRFNAAEKDTVITTIRGDDTTDVILTDTTIQSVFGRLLRVFTFLIDVRHVFDDEETIRIADSIGLIYTEQGPEYRIGLGGAVIDGVKYGVIASVRDEKTTPDRYSLEQNYPNPFNPSTTVKYTVPSRSHVVIRIFNVIGQPIATLVDETKAPGSYTVVWNAAQLPSGIYFYHMRAGGFTQTKRLVLVK